jgi:hypothetical protein
VSRCLDGKQRLRFANYNIPLSNYAEEFGVDAITIISYDNILDIKADLFDFL